MELHNYMEDAVSKNIEKVLSKYDNICKCNKCKLDIAAIALNNLPTYYTVTEKGMLYSKVKELEPQYEVDIVREITKAIKVVSKQPHHEL